ncbi:MAG: hypothetical protein QOD75_2393 [Blastocatellia bacterium]|nr:hypothetical protein [Blastocatellia bacterium]
MRLTVLLGIAFGAFGLAQAAQSTPVLISNSTSTRAIALELTTMRPEPIPLSSSVAFGTDNRTRITLFAINLDLISGEGASALTANAEDAAHNLYSMTVEYVGQVPPDLSYPDGAITKDFRGVYMIVLRLNDAMGDLGDVLIRLNLHGVSSNRVRLGIGHIGGGPTDDLGAVPTPAPATPPPMVTPQTIAEYQAQFANAGPTSGAYPDGLRFLEQATWGPTDSDLQHLRAVGMQAYLNEQFNQPPLFSTTQSNYPTPDNYPTDGPTGCPAGSPATCGRDHYTMYPLQTQFFQNALTRPDQLRQRVAFALHQLIPVSGADLNGQPAWVAPTLQIFDKNAFGNFKQILMDVTLNAGMGEYLNMRGNSKGNPNENYAREVLQLFSVGVDLLNQDGTPVLDSQGNRIPTYSQADITNFARVFTGWNLSPNKIWVGDGVTGVPNYTDPMVLVSNAFNTADTTQKTVLNGVVLPACGASCANTTAGNTATRNYKTTELNLAIDNLFNHQNTGPYLCSQLIHQMVTSNPSPAYVGRCSAAFANNGSGSRGDMKAVVTAILLDPEARGDMKNAPTYGHLREPVLLVADLLRTFNGTSDGNITSNSTRGGLLVDMGQNVFNPPTVFSYYPADLGLPGTNLLGPEFGILDTSTTYKRANFVNTLFMVGIPASFPDRPTGTQVNYSSYQAILTGGGTPQNLVDALDTAMMHNTMSSSAKATIVSTITTITNANATTQAQQRTQTAIYLIATSSQFQVQR